MIDDASHLYGPTKNSFECLFPLLRRGGLYIIEDWAWEHWDEFKPPHPLAKEEGLSRLITDLVAATGTSQTLINSLTIYRGFTVVERGGADLSVQQSFDLRDHIWRRPTSGIELASIDDRS